MMYVIILVNAEQEILYYAGMPYETVTTWRTFLRKGDITVFNREEAYKTLQSIKEQQPAIKASVCPLTIDYTDAEGIHVDKKKNLQHNTARSCLSMLRAIIGE